MRNNFQIQFPSRGLMDSLTKLLELPASINTDTSISLITATVVTLFKQFGAGWIVQRFEVY